MIISRIKFRFGIPVFKKIKDATSFAAGVSHRRR
jgi:hypothetical protein